MATVPPAVMRLTWIDFFRLLWKKKKSCLKRKRFSKKLTDEELKAKNARKEEFRSKVDDVFLVVFPVLFLVFNLVGFNTNQLSLFHLKLLGY